MIRSIQKRELDAQIVRLDLQLRTFRADYFRLAELLQLSDEHPDDEEIADAVSILRKRLTRIIKAMSVLNDWEKNVVFLHYEMHLSYQQMEEYLYYSKKTAQLKTRKILEKVIRADPYIT